MFKDVKVIFNLMAHFMLVTVFLISLNSASIGDETNSNSSDRKDQELIVKDWLLLGPWNNPYPAFCQENKDKTEPSELLCYEHLLFKEIRPEKDTKVNSIGGENTRWRSIKADNNGIVSIPYDSGFPRIAYLATYIETSRWTKLTIDAECTAPFKVEINGESVIKDKRGNSSGLKGNVKNGMSKLKQGKHLLLVKTVYIPSDTLEKWQLSVKISTSPRIKGMVELSLDPQATLNISHILDKPTIETVKISPDGEYIALSISKKNFPEGNTDKWIEIRESKTGELIRTLSDIKDYSNLQWAPRGKSISYIISEEDRGTIRVLELNSGRDQSIIEDVEHLSSFTWSPDCSFVIYSVKKEEGKNNSGVKRLRGIYDRNNSARKISELFIASVPTGNTRKLASGKYSTLAEDIHPDGNRVLITRNYEDLSERPYIISELAVVDINTHTLESLWKGHWLRGASWSPDGEKILISAGPSSFGERGLNTSEKTIPNDYDTQLYLFDPVTGEATSLTKDFSPSVRRAVWNRGDNNIYVIAEETSLVNLFKLDPRSKEYERIDINADIISGGDIALNKPVAVLECMSADNPPWLYSIDLRKSRSEVIFKPADKIFSHIKIGKVEDWDFETREGDIIKGRVHYPPKFDDSKKYPCIVYYYGGTSPVTRSFGGRYPKNLWASMGYVVYVLQPSGATGFGQDFSARHVNDWGKTVVNEIVTGVDKLLKTHPLIDPERVGCIGASFGGFITQLLLTKTDIFAAAVSHAGISSISSYWGEGYWGYAYNAVSAAESFPWNRPDIYIEQSPLFSADKVNTPLLLLHGTSDTNVPPGESEQMYTALKLLGREVEYIRFADQNHFILDYKKRIKWSDAQLAWFDKWLKKQPDWWDDMYPPLEKETKDKGKPPEPIEEITGIQKIDTEKLGTILFGNITREQVVETFPEWENEYFDYTPGREITEKLASHLGNIDITCILGSWCSDSQREVPRMWKVLETTGYPSSTMKMIAVGSSRFTEDMGISPEILSWSSKTKESYSVERVATFIIYLNGKEIGRIIETPEVSLEEDLLNILLAHNP